MPKSTLYAIINDTQKIFLFIIISKETYMFILPYIFLAIGFFALIKGADFFVDGASSIAKKLGIPDLIVGLTIVAMGTSAPELATSISAALGGSSDIAVGNVVGSNILNILIILGLSALIKPLHVDKDMFKRDIPVMLISAAMLPILTFIGKYKLNFISGLIFVAFFIFYIYLTIRAALKYKKEHADEEPDETIKSFPWWKSILLTVSGALIIIVGAHFSVESAIIIAKSWGVGEDVIGLTVVALGTSLPELITSVVAAKKGNSDIALGNIVGSNIFNILFILGTTLLISQVSVPFPSFIDGCVMVGFSAYLAITALTGKKLSRIEGASYLVLYVGYAVYLFIR